MKTQIVTRKQAAASLGNAPIREAMIPVWRRAREYTDEALGSLVGLMRDPDESGSLRAFCADRILDRAWGKAPIMIAGDEDRPIRVDVRTFDSTQVAALESALVQALGDSLANTALPLKDDTPLKSAPSEGLAMSGDIAAPGIDIAASGADKGST